MKNKCKIIFITIGIFLVLVTILLIIPFFFSDTKKNQNQYFNKTIEETIKSVNEINAVLRKENLEETKDVSYEGDFECFKYIGKDTKKYIELIEKTYRYPFEQYSNFKVKDDNLYVCFLPTCLVEDIADYKLVVDEENEKSVDIGNGIYTLNKEGENWKFDFPVINCK